MIADCSSPNKSLLIQTGSGVRQSKQLNRMFVQFACSPSIFSYLFHLYTTGEIKTKFNFCCFRKLFLLENLFFQWENVFLLFLHLFFQSNSNHPGSSRSLFYVFIAFSVVFAAINNGNLFLNEKGNQFQK